MSGRYGWFALALVGCGTPDSGSQWDSNSASDSPGESGEACEICFEAPVRVSDGHGRLSVAHLPQADAVFVDSRAVHVHMLFRDGAGSLREQWFGGSDERLYGSLVDLDDDGFDDFLYCSIHSSVCQALAFEDDLLVPFASIYAGFGGVAGVPSQDGLPARILEVYGDTTWLIFASGATRGAPLPVEPTEPVVAGDFDGDGEIEVAAPVDDQLVALELDAAGVAYDVATTTTLPVDAVPIAVTDLDGDGRDDVLVSTREQTLVVLRMEADGWVSADPITLTRQPLSIGIGDLDEDGRMDLAIEDQSTPAPTNEPPQFDRVLILAQTELGDFERHYVPFPDVSSVAMFDVDDDGHLDLVVSSPDGIHHMLADR